ncbi:glutathione S-transferase family protein [Noviherbaspirillum cavernae]|uniref:Glutathione S-transferase family protein n=1 Tax=Noviherbaspirillum cavernae TaxID=2320862 RepID=A0A418X0Y4_9BURK|nr:glutathione S-transferase family protein [Noviherbaspirillum cavernae]RJG06160.1 glutathione S-transferase family protein [Noviherbaspirillum cavernae]
MPEIIFHHYPNSPFSEKIRLIFGFKKLAWQSVIIPAIMPKPNVVALTGGYRRTPVMQIGADIYCDTTLMADVLERIAPTPALYPEPLAGLSRTLAQWADATLFWTVIAYVFQPASMPYLLNGLTQEQVKAFASDRAAMRGNAPRMTLPEATGALTEYLHRLENMLSRDEPFLLGSQPCIADFSVYHCIWFLQLAKPVAGILDIAPNVKTWSGRMAEFGHHDHERMSAEQALEIARNSHAAAVDDRPFFDAQGAVLGDRVEIMPTDYALDPVAGELVQSTLDEFAVRRTDPQAGTVVVHFPRIGFQLKKI